MLVTVATDTVTEQVAETLPTLAVIVALPFATEVTKPLEETVATPVSLDAHETVAVLVDGIKEAVNC